MILAGFALQNLWRRKVRTTLTISAVALGIAAIVALTGVAWGFEASWQKANDARGTDLIVTRIASENAMPSAFAAGSKVDALKRYAHVQQVAGLLSEMLTIDESSTPVFVFGWEFDSYLWKHLKLIEGRWPSHDDESSVVIGSLAADLLHQKLGSHVEIEGKQFEVIGIYQSPAVVENGAILMTLSEAQQVMGKPGKVNVLNIKLDGTATETDVALLQQEVKSHMPGFAMLTSGELVANNTVVRISKAMSDATIAIASLVGALVVFNTMLMSINERRREIGVLLALGWTRSLVVKLILFESAGLSLVGGAAGIVIGIAIDAGLEHLELMRGKIDAVYSAEFLVAVAGLAIGIGVVGGLFPALAAARLRPAQALRQI